MASRLTVEELIRAAGQLATEKRERWVRALASYSRMTKRHITELRALAKEISRSQDAQAHIDAERDSWKN